MILYKELDSMTFAIHTEIVIDSEGEFEVSQEDFKITGVDCNWDGKAMILTDSTIAHYTYRFFHEQDELFAEEFEEAEKNHKSRMQDEEADMLLEKQRSAIEHRQTMQPLTDLFGCMNETYKNIYG